MVDRDLPINLIWIHAAVSELTDGRRTPAPRQ